MTSIIDDSTHSKNNLKVLKTLDQRLVSVIILNFINIFG